MFHFNVVDTLAVPDIEPGEYTLSFRWDCEREYIVTHACQLAAAAAAAAAATATHVDDDEDGCSYEVRVLLQKRHKFGVFAGNTACQLAAATAAAAAAIATATIATP